MKEFEKSGVESGFDAPLYVSMYARELPSKQARGRWIHKYPRTGRLLTLLGDFWAFLTLPGTRVIYHETYYSGFRWARKQNRKIVTVYDCIHEVFPELFDRNDPVFRYRKSSLERADEIICISQSTKNDLLRFYQVPAEKLHVVPLAVQTTPSATSQTVQKSILFVGHRNLYKNAQTLLRAYASSRARKAGIKLVFFGGGPANVEEAQIIESFGIKDMVSFVSGDDQVLFQHYVHALAFVFPSEYEGFGLPTLEAMSLGCPVICSNTSSFPEVAGDAALYFSPKDAQKLQEHIDLVAENPEIRSQLIERGYKNVARFSWRRCAEETIKVYERALAR